MIQLHPVAIIKKSRTGPMDGTPLLDIKPVFRKFEAKKEIQQPDWVADLMKHYRR
jgi:tRNA (Thr-GGU) A37 N-methylase